MFDVTVIGSVAGDAPFTAARIAELLAHPRAILRMGGEFVGRPTTAVFADAHDLVKLRTEFEWAPAVMDKWVRNTLAREQQLGIHHPDKTWFLTRRPADDRWLIGNICPRLLPLHQALAEPPQDDPARTRRRAWFHALFRMYASVAQTHGLRLDEGLSNFGLDAQRNLYYLDDDLYDRDDWISLAHGIGTWFRLYGWFDPTFAAGLGQDLRASLDEAPHPLHQALTVVGHLRGLFMPQSERRAALAAFTNALAAATPSPQTRPAWHGQRYLALLGDIHANQPALDAVLDFLRQQGIRDGLVLGDIVGYGPHPAACIDRIAESSFLVIQGNHDYAAATGHINDKFSGMARWALEWTLPRLDATRQHWLAQLPRSHEAEHWLAVHGAPLDPECFNGYVYLLTYEDNLDHLARRDLPLCFHGHSHMPMIYAELISGRRDGFALSEQRLGIYRHALVCPGSVGQPRNRRTEAQFAIWDRRQQRLRLLSVPYAIETTLEAMRAEGFPENLRQRLAIGT